MTTVDLPIYFDVRVANQFVSTIYSPDHKWYFSASQDTDDIAVSSTPRNNSLTTVELSELLPAFADSFRGEILDCSLSITLLGLDPELCTHELHF